MLTEYRLSCARCLGSPQVQLQLIDSCGFFGGGAPHLVGFRAPASMGVADVRRDTVQTKIRESENTYSIEHHAPLSGTVIRFRSASRM